MTNRDAIETPAVVIDLEKVERNIDRAQAAADAAGVALRPHIKTHKLVRFAKRQMARGAIGITCQKLGEAEAMARGGLDDILLTYNILGAAKLARLRALAGTLRLSITCDHAHVADGYAREMQDAEAPLRVFVECDTGMGRCGVQTPEAALDLARAIDGHAELQFEGLMTYPAAGRHADAEAWLAQAAEVLREAGLPARTISTGGTPDLWQAIATTEATEYRPGTYIYMDRSLVHAGACTFEDCALSVMATVVSTPARGRVVIDAGSKALSSDTLGLDGFGHVTGYPEARIASLSEEHGVIDVSDCPRSPALGEILFVIPNHACVVSNLFDDVWLAGPDGRYQRVPVDARGMVT